MMQLDASTLRSHLSTDETLAAGLEGAAGGQLDVVSPTHYRRTSSSCWIA
jgi:hypothetical protein